MRASSQRAFSVLAIAVFEIAAFGFSACGSSDDSQATPTNGDATTTSNVDAASDAAVVTDGSTSNDAASSTPCWPYDRPDLSVLHASPKKVFAHYFAPFPISIDNKPAAVDYYATQFLTPDGESGKHLAYGGYLRERPLPQTPWEAGVDYESANLEIEVRRAVNIGLDGFTFDLLSTTPTDPNWMRLVKMLAVIPKVDSNFKVQLVFDMTAAAFGGGGGTDADAENGITTTLAAVGKDPSLLRLSSGKIVVSAFAADARSAAFWTNAISTAHTAGFDLAFIPMPVGGFSGAAFTGVPLFGASSWGVRTVAGAPGLVTETAIAHDAGLLWMGPVAPQDSRPKDFNFTECNNSAAFRAQWGSAITGDADWVQLVTWNDYSEDSEVSPSSQTNDAFYDLSGYYTAWMKTGKQPVIARDALYYFHRAHSMDVTVAPPDLDAQTMPFAAVNGAPQSNMIEVVGFLTAPGTLQITAGSSTQSQDVPAGIQSFQIPLVAGSDGTPIFRLLRGGTKIVELTSATTINNTIVYQDPLYHAGTSLTCTPASE
jgi:hypothetical protein